MGFLNHHDLDVFVYMIDHRISGQLRIGGTVLGGYIHI